MSSTETISTAIVDYLKSAPGVAAAIETETNLLDSGALDSLLVMDLVCFVELRFQVAMQPNDITPQNLRSVKDLTRFVVTRLTGREAA